ncbi:MAG: hypothetical protein AAGJ35_15005, partial [Myxococcota bacterium]
ATLWLARAWHLWAKQNQGSYAQRQAQRFVQQILKPLHSSQSIHNKTKRISTLHAGPLLFSKEEAHALWLQALMELQPTHPYTHVVFQQLQQQRSHQGWSNAIANIQGIQALQNYLKIHPHTLPQDLKLQCTFGAQTLRSMRFDRTHTFFQHHLQTFSSSSKLIHTSQKIHPRTQPMPKLSCNTQPPKYPIYYTITREQQHSKQHNPPQHPLRTFRTFHPHSNAGTPHTSSPNRKVHLKRGQFFSVCTFIVLKQKRTQLIFTSAYPAGQIQRLFKQHKNLSNSVPNPTMSKTSPASPLPFTIRSNSPYQQRMWIQKLAPGTYVYTQTFRTAHSGRVYFTTTNVDQQGKTQKLG